MSRAGAAARAAPGRPCNPSPHLLCHANATGTCSDLCCPAPPTIEILLSDEEASTRYRTLFISDVHLGSKGCQAELFLDFLKHNDADTIYLVGDIVDGWRLKRGWYWPQAHNDVVQKLLRKVRKGTQMFYIPGNHDEFARDY